MNTCETCKWFDNESCRRYPPRWVLDVDHIGGGTESWNTKSLYPEVSDADWCGEWADKGYEYKGQVGQ